MLLVVAVFSNYQMLGKIESGLMEKGLVAFEKKTDTEQNETVTLEFMRNL